MAFLVSFLFTSRIRLMFKKNKKLSINGMTQNNVWYFITTRVLPTPIGWCFSGDFHQSSWDREDPSPGRRWDHHGPPSERAQRDARPRLLRALQGNTQPAYLDSTIASEGSRVQGQVSTLLKPPLWFQRLITDLSARVCVGCKGLFPAWYSLFCDLLPCVRSH